MGQARLVTGASAGRRLPARAVVTIGVFDGVHVAHRQLIRAVVRLARRRRRVTSGIITFHPDPQRVLHPARVSPALMPIEERLARLRLLGVDWIWVIPFTCAFARVRAERFVRRVLIGQLRAGAVVVGDGFLFGKDREGDLRILRRLGASAGMQVVSVASIRRHGQPVSSSRIRRLIAEGLLAQAAQLLGRPHALVGTVVRGTGRGRRFGIPTANIRLLPQALPPQGVYAVRLRAGSSGRWRPAVMNFGMRPTFGAGPVVCEVHVLGFRGRLLGRRVVVSLLKRLRGERYFASPAALIAQVHRDISRARRLLSYYS
ncbi:MAG: riboflavin biosynthesis protein RibF [Candidatus Omnitrophica bacterium]|nr:riboflavin biosynthesis protein RibF [Candidatus Omnitrophota bacterium]